jgi:hypothetical protein
LIPTGTGIGALKKNRYQSGTNIGYLFLKRYQSGIDIRLNDDFGLVYGQVYSGYEAGITSSPYQLVLVLKLVPDLDHTRLVCYLIPVFIPVLIPVCDPIHHINTG